VLHEDWDTAMVHYRRSESLIPALEAAGDLYTRSEIHRHLGFYHLVADRQPAIAVEHLQISLDLREQQGEPRRVPSGLVSLAWAERENGNPRRAVVLLRRAAELARAEGLLPARIADAQDSLAEAEAALAQMETGV
jgi:tetratricopeptide (TPR) repeat protein